MTWFHRVCALVVALSALGAMQASAGEGRSLRGRAVDESGNPIEKVEVTAAGGIFAPGFVKSVESGKDGVFSFDGVPERFIVFFKQVRQGDHPGLIDRPWKCLEGGAPAFQRLATDESKDMGDVVFRRRGAAVCGTVKTAEGKPMAGAEVWLVTGLGVHQDVDVTDESGGFALRSFDTRENTPIHVLEVFTKGSDAPAVFEKGPLAVWEETRFDLVLPKERGSIFARLTHDGEPVKDVFAYLYIRGQKSLVTRFAPARTGKDGALAWEGLPVGEYEVWVAGAGIPRRSFSVTCPSEGAEFRIEKSLFGALEGYAETTLDGRPADELPQAPAQEGIKQALFLCDAEGELLRPLVPAAYLTRTGKGFSFTVENLDPGEYRFQVRDGAPTGLPRPPRDLPGGRKSCIGTFLFEPIDPGEYPAGSGSLMGFWLVRIEAGERARLNRTVALTMEDLLDRIEKGSREKK